MALEKDRQISKTRLQEETLYRVGIEVGVLSHLQKPFGFKDTFDGKMNEEGLYGDSRPLSSVLDPEIMEEVDALAWLSILDPESMGRTGAIPFYYGYNLVDFQEGCLNPVFARTGLSNLEYAQHSAVSILDILQTAHQRVTEILERKQIEIASVFDERVLEIFLTSVQPEDTELLGYIESRTRLANSLIKSRVDRALTRMAQITQKLPIS